MIFAEFVHLHTRRFKLLLQIIHLHYWKCQWIVEYPLKSLDADLRHDHWSHCILERSPESLDADHDVSIEIIRHGRIHRSH